MSKETYKVITQPVKRRYYNVNSKRLTLYLYVCLSGHSTARDSVVAKKVIKKQVNAFDEKNIFCYYGTSNEIPILNMFNPYLSNATMVSWDL